MTTLAAQMFTLRDYMDTPQRMGETLKRVRRIGYEAVQLSGHGPVEPQHMADMVQAADLIVAATHIPFQRMEEDLDAVIADHHLWGCKYVGLGALPPAFRDSAEGVSEFARRASAVARGLQQAGLTFIYHNHHFEFHRMQDGRRMYEILIEETDPALQFEIDTYWVQAAGGDPAHWLRRVAGRSDVVHVKDMAVDADGTAHMAEVGEGNLNWPAILEACKEAGVRWHIVEQDICRQDPFDSLALSLKHLKGMGLA